jgi:hypothetical protein
MSQAASSVPERYVRALDGDDPIESQRKAPKRIAKLLKGLSEKQLARRPAPDKWSIKEVVAHLADGEIVLGSRVRFVAAQDRPLLPGYDQDRFVAGLGVERVSTEDLLEAFAAARALNVALLRRLPKEAFQRIGLHAERGEESIATMVAMYAGHDRIHEQQIAAAREALRAAKAQKKKGKKTREPQKPAKKARRAAEDTARAATKSGDGRGAKPSADKLSRDGRAPKPETRAGELAGSPG